MKEIDIVFNIDYKSSMDVDPLYKDIPNYIEFIQVNNIEQFTRLINLLENDVKCYIWAHPSFSAERVEKGFQSKIITESIPVLERLNIEFIKITRSSGKTAEKGFYEVSSMLEMRNNGMKNYLVKKLREILLTQEVIESKSKINGEKIKILFIAASPDNQGNLNLGSEQRKIDEALMMSSFRTNFELVSKHGAKFETLSRELMQQKPKIVHFSGHGDTNCLIFEFENADSHEVPANALEMLFQTLNDNIECVVLNACYSAVQAEAISKHNIYVVGMNKPVDDNDAATFSKGFYQAIGEEKDIRTAFNVGYALYLASCIEEDKNIPELWYKGEKISE